VLLLLLLLLLLHPVGLSIQNKEFKKENTSAVFENVGMGNIAE